MPNALITGITGQDGSYLAELLLKKGYRVYGLVRRTSTFNDERIHHLLSDVEIIDADLLDQISRKVPSDDKIKLDIMELDIRPKKTFIKGTVDSAAAVDEIGAKLKEIECYEDVSKGAITEVSGGGKQFTISINSKCP